jgi:hypothetical protein
MFQILVVGCLVLILLSTVTIAWLLAGMARQLRSLREQPLAELLSAVRGVHTVLAGSPPGMPHLPENTYAMNALLFHIPCGFHQVASYPAVWEWREGQWVVLSPLPAGAHPGFPPARPGGYEGECVSTASADQLL